MKAIAGSLFPHVLPIAHMGFIGRYLDRLTLRIAAEEKRAAEISIDPITDQERDALSSLVPGDIILIDGRAHSVDRVDMWGQTIPEWENKKEEVEVVLTDGTTLTIRTDFGVPRRHHVRHWRHEPTQFLLLFKGTRGVAMPFKALEIPSKGVRIEKKV